MGQVELLRAKLRLSNSSLFGVVCLVELSHQDCKLVLQLLHLCIDNSELSRGVIQLLRSFTQSYALWLDGHDNIVVRNDSDDEHTAASGSVRLLLDDFISEVF